MGNVCICASTHQFSRKKSRFSALLFFSKSILKKLVDQSRNGHNQGITKSCVLQMFSILDFNPEKSVRKCSVLHTLLWETTTWVKKIKKKKKNCKFNQSNYCFSEETIYFGTMPTLGTAALLSSASNCQCV